MDIAHQSLKTRAKQLRLAVLETVKRVGKGHLGGTFSCVDLLVALYYGPILRFDATAPQWPDRDRFLIGKGHACLALYHIWADLGFFSNDLLDDIGCPGSKLGNQLDIWTPGSEYNTGSLGHVIGVGAGMAISAELDGRAYKVVALVGDAECDEGSVWESVLSADRLGLKNLIVVVDRNRLSVTGEIKSDDRFTLEDKFEAFGWTALTIDGHSFEEILSAFNKAYEIKEPVAIVANTVKGKGVSFMENGVRWHHSMPNEDELNIARRELSE